MKARDEDTVHGLDAMTTPLRTPRDDGGPSPSLRAARAITGALSAGLVLLAIGVLAAQALTSQPGPGAPMLILHLVGAAVAVGLQLAADRLRGRAPVLCVLGVLVVASCVLWFGWYQ